MSLDIIGKASGMSAHETSEAASIGTSTPRAALDIMAKAPFPAGALSNFAPHAFALDGVPIASMEGFLQSLKFPDPVEQVQICRLPGAEAQSRGRRQDWSSGTLWWRRQSIDRLSDAYQALLDRAYEALFAQSRRFREALAATEHARLVHGPGKSDPFDTILTAAEFCGRLERLRAVLPRT